MTAADLIQKMRERKGTVLSVALHLLVLGWGLASFSARSVEAVPPEDIIPVDISMDNAPKMTTGIKSGKKENPKPLVDKVAEAKPAEDAIGKVDKQDVVTSTSAPEAKPKPPVEKPVEKKPDPKPEPKKEEPKQAQKKPDEKANDPIAEALKNEAKKPPPPKPEAKAAPPQPPKPKERVFDQTKIASLLDKRDPSHQAVTGATLNSNAALGSPVGNSNKMVATWKGAFVGAVRRCFNFPYNGQDADQFEVDIDIQLRPDGSVGAPPVVVAVRGPQRSIGNAMGEAAKRAVEQCSAYTFLPKEQYETWKYIPMTFGLKDML